MSHNIIVLLTAPFEINYKTHNEMHNFNPFHLGVNFASHIEGRAPTRVCEDRVLGKYLHSTDRR
jgi:hypothetical protein